MKKTFTILILFLHIIIYSQKIEDILKLDTIYIEYNNVKSSYKIIEDIDKEGFVNRLYGFTSLNKKNKNSNILVLFRKYKSVENRVLNKFAEVKTVNKLFLNKHKKKIIGANFFLKYESCDLEKILNEKKVFYLIDLKENKKNKIFLFEVNATVYCVRGE